MADLTTQVLRPNSTPQAGTGVTVTGAGSASTVLADSLDTTFVSINGLCRLDSQVLRVGFPTPTIPAGAKVYSVGLRRRILTQVASTPAPTIPVCNHWFRSVTGTIQVAGQVQDILKYFFNSTCPSSPVTTPTTAVWVEENLGTFLTGPGGQSWDATTNLNGLTLDQGRGDASTGTTLSVSAVYLDVTYQRISTITVTAPTSTIPDTRPTVKWSYASPDSQPQAAYQVAIYTAAQVASLGFAPFVTVPIQGSGVKLGEDLQWTLTADITDGVYSAYVQATSQWSGTGAFPTAIASSTWTRTATPASPPPSAVLDSAVFDEANNRVQLTFHPGGSSPATTAFSVQASRDNGASWGFIPSLSLLPANGMTPLVVIDYVANLNAISQYRVIAFSGSPYVAAQQPSNVLSVTPVSDKHWLKNPNNPLLNTPLPVKAPKTDEGIKTTKRRTMGTFYPLGGEGSEVLPFIVYGPTHGDEYEFELFFELDDLTNVWPIVDELDRTGGVLLLQKPDATQLWIGIGPGATGQDTTENYDALPGHPKVVQWRRRKLVMTQTREPDYF